MNATKGGYAEVNSLRMYYEVHGEGRPLVLLHGAYMTVDAMGSILPGLAESRRVIVPEMQGHGRTADIDRPIAYEGMADDVAALLRHLGIEEADAFGYSMGGGIALHSSPSATRARCAGWWSPRPPTRATACSPSCTR
jgi:pimeloyl-ACP methyl ester carboxylesterase